METSEFESAGRANWLDRLIWFAALASGVVLFAVMLLVATDVGLRYVLNAPFFGAQDLIEVSMVVVALLAMAYCARTNGHIAVDVFDRALGVTGRRVGNFVNQIVSIALLALLVLSAIHKSRDAFTYSEATNLLGIPLGYLYVVIVVGFLLQLLVVLGDLMQNVKGTAQDEA